MLMARRLVAAGVRFVTLTYGGWDMHDNITAGMRGSMPAFDQAFAALDSRSGPHRSARRDAGHGLQRVRPHAQDQRHRRSRSLAQGVQRGAGRRRHQAGLDLRGLERRGLGAGKGRDGPADLATTIFYQLGIIADKELMAPGNRPIEIVDGGKVRKELLA